MQKTRVCQNCKKSFETDAQDFAFYEKIKVPAPTWCPECRFQRMLTFWPFGKFHLRQCDLSGKKIVSIFPAKANFPVYDSVEWNSDKWSAPKMNFDIKQSFFKQLKKLQSKTPHPHQLGAKSIKCDYSDDVWSSKNCYLCRSLANGENLSYSYRVVDSRDSVDITYSFNLEQCYDCTYCFNSYKLKYSFNSRNCTNSEFLYDCRNCQNCFMSWNLRNKSYCIFNKQYTKEEYLEKIQEFKMNDYNEVNKLRKQFLEILQKEVVHRENLNNKTINSKGNYLNECKNCNNVYFWEKSENCLNTFRGLSNKDCVDSAGLFNCELCYNSVQSTDCYDVGNSMFATNCRYSEYLDSCIDCEHCFGCVGLKKKKYCILNKQYSQIEYEKLVKKIKQDIEKEYDYHGGFLPLDMAFIGYNLSLAEIYFPKNKKEVEKYGGRWEELEDGSSGNREIISFINNIDDVKDDVLRKGFKCEKSARFFNITSAELKFYRDNKIPLPHHYPDVRTMDRILKMTGPFSREDKCYFCQEKITTYFPENWEYQKIACEKCYNQEVG